MFTRILVAVDGSDAGEVAVSYATALARQPLASARVVYVNEYLVGGRGFTALTDREARLITDKALAAMAEAGVDTDARILRATCFDVASSIADAAHEWSADVIVLGSRRRRWSRVLPTKGMRERVTAITGLPTLIAPPPLRVTSRLAPELTGQLGPPNQVRAASK